MRSFEPISLDSAELIRELNDLETLLMSAPHLRERKSIAPFFKSHRQLVAALDLFHGNISRPDRVSTELSIMGDFTCDAAAGDSVSNAFLLIEFEDANPHSVLAPAPPGKIKPWSSRFEHGASQLLDWAWRLDCEAKSGPAFRRIFERDHLVIHFLLIAGRDSDLTSDDLGRVRWRTGNVSFGSYRMNFLTFDAVLGGLRLRLL